MPILVVENFENGLDVRKSPLTAPPGSLQLLQDAVLTNGAEIERRKSFVLMGQLPPTSTGLAAWNSQITVYSDEMASGPITMPGMPIPVNVQHVAMPSGVLTKILDWDSYSNQSFIVAQNNFGQNTMIWLSTAGQVNAPVSGTFCRTHSSKMYAIDGSDLRFSNVGDPGTWVDQDINSPLGAGYIDMSTDDADAEQLRSIEVYYDRMAVMARLVTLIWYLDPDPTQNSLLQTLRIGTMAPLSAVQFGTGDVLFLADSGIRSLRAMNISMAAAVIDVGSPIDPLLTTAILNHPTDAAASRGIVEPIKGRYWLSMGNGDGTTTIYVLSYFPSAKVSAWSTFFLPFSVDYMAYTNNQVYLRSGNDLYLYGGADGLQYDYTNTIVRTPMMHNQAPTIWKRISSIDLMIQGTWALDIGMNPGAPFTYERCGIFTGETYSLQKIPFAGYGTHIGLQLTSQDNSVGRIGGITINYQDGQIKGGT